MLLAVAVNSPNSLLQIHWIPRQIEIEKNASVLQVDSFATRRSADHNFRATGLFESLFSSGLGSVVTTLEYNHTLTRICTVDLLSEHLNTTQECCKYDNPFVWILSPKDSQRGNELLDFGFNLLREFFE